MDLYEEITRLIKELDVSVRQLRKSGTELAEAEKRYKVSLRQEAVSYTHLTLPTTSRV